MCRAPPAGRRSHRGRSRRRHPRKSMSSPFWSASIASGSSSNVYLSPGGPLTVARFVAPCPRPPSTRPQRRPDSRGSTASKFCASNVARSMSVGSDAVVQRVERLDRRHRLGRARRGAAQCRPPAPRRPLSVKRRIDQSIGDERLAPGPSSPCATSAGPTLLYGLGEVDDHERVRAARDVICSRLGVVARLLDVVDHRLADRRRRAPPSVGRERLREAGAVGVVASADADPSCPRRRRAPRR